MTIRNDMLKAAARAASLLDESTELVIKFTAGRLCDDGGFSARAGQSDLYYTVFGIETLLALEAKLPAEQISNYLDQFADGASLDLVHLACLARCRADLSPPRSADTQAAIARRIERYRSADGGYNNSPNAAHGAAYGCFLALGALQDLDIKSTDPDKLTDCVASLKSKDGGYSNLPANQIGATPATAAALTLRHYLGEPVDEAAAQWLLNQFDPKGGFLATPALREVGIPDLLSTATALHTLTLLSVSTDHIKDKCLDFLDTLWTGDGGFCANWADQTPDCEYTFYGLLALGNLSD